MKIFNNSNCLRPSRHRAVTNVIVDQHCCPRSLILEVTGDIASTSACMIDPLFSIGSNRIGFTVLVFITLTLT